MAPVSAMMGRCSLVLPRALRDRLWGHLFPGDGEEHGAVLTAGVARSPRGLRLLGREVFLARDGIDYVPGTRGHRMLRGEFILDKVIGCREEGLAYLAVHNHGGSDTVAFSGEDLRSHERGYPALLDVTRGLPVGALVVAPGAVAGDIWVSRSERLEVAETRVLGPALERLYSAPPPRPPRRDESYDRQARLFGDAGQDLLAGARVGVIGAGGAGSLLVEYLARLGVGELVIADPKRVDITNLPRIVGATRRDVRTWLTAPGRPQVLRRMGRRLAARKVDIARRVARGANPDCRITTLPADVTEEAVAREFTACDYLFLAADTMQARLVFNAIVHQYLIPGVQVGAKVRVQRDTGKVMDIFTTSRPVMPGSGCLWCNGLISPEGLQREAATQAEREEQDYVTDPTVIAPSVITLNATAASQAADDFLLFWTGLADPAASLDFIRFLPRTREVRLDQPRADSFCSECGVDAVSRRAKGDAVSLPTRPS